MNELRIESYLDKSLSLIELLSISSSLIGHILRSHFIIHYLNLLNATEKSNVQEFGWSEAEDGCFMPDICLSPIPRYSAAKCGCKKGCSQRCQCSFADIKCNEFCVSEQLAKMHKNSYKNLRTARTLIKAMYFYKLKLILFS